MSFTDNSTNNPSFSSTQQSYNHIHNINGIILNSSSANDSSTQNTYNGPTQVLTGGPRRTRPRPQTPLPAPIPTQAQQQGGIVQARPVFATPQTAAVAFVTNPPQINNAAQVRTVTPDQRVNQIANSPLLPIHVYEVPAFYRVNQPYRLRVGSSRIHHLRPIGINFNHPLMSSVRGRPQYFGVDPTSNTNFIISHR